MTRRNEPRENLSQVDRINLVGADFALQCVRKVQGAPLPGSNIVAVVPKARGMRLGVPDHVKGFVGIDIRRNHGATAAAGHCDVESGHLACSVEPLLPGQRRVGGRRVQIGVVSNQGGARRRGRNRIDIVGARVARGKSQVITFELIDICQQAVDGLPRRREYIKARDASPRIVFTRISLSPPWSPKSIPWHTEQNSNGGETPLGRGMPGRYAALSG
jgi:hypothetical protein